ncbi:hypothetical protein PSPO01_00182 [Paraphaeosphaeria sporulosa]
MPTPLRNPGLRDRHSPCENRSLDALEMTRRGLRSNAATVMLSCVVLCAGSAPCWQRLLCCASSHSQPRGDHFGRAPPSFIRPFTLPNGDAQCAPAGCYPPIRHVSSSQTQACDAEHTPTRAVTAPRVVAAAPSLSPPLARHAAKRNTSPNFPEA